MYIYIYMYIICVCVYIYICIYTYVYIYIYIYNRANSYGGRSEQPLRERGPARGPGMCGMARRRAGALGVCRAKALVRLLCIVCLFVYLCICLFVYLIICFFCFFVVLFICLFVVVVVVVVPFLPKPWEGELRKPPRAPYAGWPRASC